MIEYSNIKDKNLSIINKNANENITNMNLIIEKINLKEIVEFCKDITQTLILSKGKERSIKIINDFDLKIDMFELYSDEFRLKQILLNFISNSVKFTKSGFIKIKSEFILNENEQTQKFGQNVVDVLQEKTIMPKIKISIIDTGMGIKKDDLQTLLKFEDNTMLKSTDNLNKGGSGLGLSIVKYLAQKLNHNIEINSDYGKGSQFSIIIKPQEKENEKEIFKPRYMNYTNNLKKSKWYAKDKKLSVNEINSLYRRETIQDLLIKKHLDNFKKKIMRNKTASGIGFRRSASSL